MTAFVAREDRPVVTYGPAADRDGAYVLRVSTVDGGMLEILVNERAMYDLWTEVKDTPWPAREYPGEKERLVRQVVHAATAADEAMLKDALEALGMER